MDLSFDIRGNLKPYERVEIDFETFEEIFIKSFEDETTRLQLLENYRKYLVDFSEQITNQFTQWIDGSFVSTKRNPRDIDFVTIVDHKVFEERADLIDSRFRLKGGKETYEVDAYTVRKYPEEHSQYKIYEGELVYWDHLFSWTKKNRMKKKYRKGYIEIQFDKFKI